MLSCIRAEYGDLLSKSPYLVRIQENADQKKTPYLDTFHAVIVGIISKSFDIILMRIND